MQHPLDQLIAEAELGKAAKEFLDSELGRCVIGIARQDAEDALRELGEVNPLDVEKIRALQGKARFCRYFEQWLVELFNNGENAKQVFVQQSEQ